MRELLPFNTNASPADDKVNAVDVEAPLPVTVASVSASAVTYPDKSGGVYVNPPLF